jgi:polyhydroxybutyrate depolymerase
METTMRGLMKGAAASLGSLLAIGAAAYGYFWHAPAPDLPALSSVAERWTVKVGDRERSYLAYVPAVLSQGAPLLVVLHGSAMDGAMMRQWTGYEFDRLADREGFIVLYPDGYRQNWNDCRREAAYPARRDNVDDIGFIRRLVERSVSEKGVDPRQVFAFGYSNGGQMAHRLAIEAPDMVAAVVTAGANLPTPDNFLCAPEGRTARVMLVSGTADPIVPFHGGEVSLFGFASRGMALSSTATAVELARRNGIVGAPSVTRQPSQNPDDGTLVEHLVWSKGDAPTVTLSVVQGGGHVVPQPAFRFPRLLGRTTANLNAPSEAVTFFRLRRAASRTVSGAGCEGIC